MGDFLIAVSHERPQSVQHNHFNAAWVGSLLDR